MDFKYDEFKKTLELIFEFEGYYSDDKYDKGGKTKFGITEKTLKKAIEENNLIDEVEIQNLTKEQAEKIYFEYYWKPSKAWLLSEPLTVFHFDTAVNMGIQRANKFLQTALKVVNKLDNTFKIDGIWGKNTQREVERAVLENKTLFLFSVYLNCRYHFYNQIVKRDKTQKVFLHGWLNRLSYFFKLLTENQL